MRAFRLRIMAQVLPFLLVTPGLALAQAPPTRGEATAALNPATSAAAAQYTRQQIDQMVAPIALYPDQLLTQVLMAATYPQQIVEAAQWLQDPAHAALKGDALLAALQPLPWDPSVKALVAFPQIVVMLSQHIEWTQALGVAFATQQPAVMARVQALRHLAVRSGRLRKLHHLAVREEGAAVVIAPAEPDRVFVPVYNPVVVYGDWPDRDYPPVYIPPPPDFVAETIEPGLEVSVGYGIVAPLWGWSHPDWRGDRITINRVEYTRITRNVQSVQIGPGDTWRHSGPVVLAAPAAAGPAGQAAAVPAGTVAPAAAAGVVSLPQRAASQPAKIQTQATTGAKPGATQQGQTQATTGAKPGAPATGSTAGTARRTPATAGVETTRPAARESETQHPAAMRPGKGPETATGPAKPQPRASAPEHAAGRIAPPVAPTPRPPEHAGARVPPSVPGPGTAAPAEHAARHPAAPHETAGQGVAPRTAPAARPPESAGSTVPTAHGTAPPARAAEHPAARHDVGQGSTTPPPAMAPHAPPAAQLHQPAGGHAPARPEENKQNER